jgi:hypothetical protein
MAALMNESELEFAFKVHWQFPPGAMSRAQAPFKLPVWPSWMAGGGAVFTEEPSGTGLALAASW